MQQPMRSTQKCRRGGRFASRSLILPVALSLFLARDAPARPLALARSGTEALLGAGPREARFDSWAVALEPIDVTNASTGASVRISLYDRVGEIDEKERTALECVISREPEPHALSPRVEQLVFKAAYHFGAERIFVVSGWRQHAGKHATGEALDFRLQGVQPASVAAYLRSLPRVGVGIYTHPGTRFVHVDVRDASFHWIDASPPGVHWRERQLGDRRAAERDASYAPEMDLP
jgi:uncharacterized protein YcbK (DUF882 family)